MSIALRRQSRRARVVSPVPTKAAKGVPIEAKLLRGCFPELVTEFEPKQAACPPESTALHK
jgi:hypothetical protein